MGYGAVLGVVTKRRISPQIAVSFYDDVSI
jgi:hypothetical protein